MPIPAMHAADAHEGKISNKLAKPMDYRPKKHKESSISYTELIYLYSECIAGINKVPVNGRGGLCKKGWQITIVSLSVTLYV